jgi:flagellar hook-basal body complex protein FliE
MSDPLGIIGSINRIDPAQPAARPLRPGEGVGSDFHQELKRQVSEVNRLQQDASLATQEVLTGQRDDVEAVMLAAQKADSAFRMLLAVRNKVMDAYDELKQMRV